MTPQPLIAPKRAREGTSKVRTGCSTCKARRVKCDESKPICRRCAVGGRRCGYKTPPAKAPERQRPWTVYVPPMQSQPTPFRQDAGLDFFHRYLAATLDGHFGSRFWSGLVLQLSHSEPSVRHAVSAISAIHHDTSSSLQHPAGYIDANSKAQQEWNRAVTRLSARIREHPCSILVPLVCCLLFTCIEFLKGNVESSMLHAQNGFNILSTITRNCDAAQELRRSLSSTDLGAIEDHVVPVFTRLHVLCSLAGRMTSPLYTTTAEDDSPHKDLADSRRRLSEVSDSCLRFIYDAVPKAEILQIGVDELVEQARLQTRLDTWHSQLGELLGRMRATADPVNQAALNLLFVHYKVMYIWLRVCTTAGESATDAYHADFEKLIHYAEQVTKSGGAGTAAPPPPPLSFDMHILGPLYYAALKCRHPATRRRAVELLQLAPRREGLWNAHFAYLTAKRIVELEERHLGDPRGLPDEAVRIHGLPLPNETSQTYKLGGISRLRPGAVNSGIVPNQACPGTLEIVFRTKPRGLLGEWESSTEYIEL